METVTRAEGNAVAAAPIGATDASGATGGIDRCPQCGHDQWPGGAFCEMCGTRREDRRPTAVPAEPGPATAPLGARDDRTTTPAATPIRPDPSGARSAAPERPWWADPVERDRPPGPAWSSDGRGAGTRAPSLPPVAVPRVATADPGYRVGAVPWRQAEDGWVRSVAPGPAEPAVAPRLWAVGAHLGALVGGFAGVLPAVVVPLAIWLFRRGRDPFAAAHARAALVFTLTLMAWVVVAFVGGVAMIVATLGVGALVVGPLWVAGILVAPFAWVVLHLVGAVKAASGKPYRYPLEVPFRGRSRADSPPVGSPFGPVAAPAASDGALRRTVRPASPPAAHRPARPGTSAARIETVRHLADLIAKPAVRAQVLGLVATAGRILAVIGEDAARRGEPDQARATLDRYLDAAEAILGRYVRLSERGVASAGAALARVEGHDLPLLATKLDELYERVHRGDVVALETASEMLEFDLAGPAPRAAAPMAAD